MNSFACARFDRKERMKDDTQLSKVLIRKMILNAIPYNEWILASEIARKLELGSHKIARVISRDLLYVEVERKPMKAKQGKLYVYRRLTRARVRKL